MHPYLRHRVASPFAFRSVLIAAATLAAGWSVLQGFRLMHSKYNRVRTVPFSGSDDVVARRFLVVGDSTGVGIGSVDARSTVPGRLAAAFPGTEVVNRSQEGAQSADIADQIASSDGRFDLILIFVGADDVIRLSPRALVTEAAERALAIASGRANHVAVIPPADIGTAPVWVWPLDALYSHRAERVRRAWQVAMRERTHVHLVDLRLPRERDPFRIKPRRYYSADGLHPSADGYALWFAQITRQVPFFSELDQQQTLPI